MLGGRSASGLGATHETSLPSSSGKGFGTARALLPTTVAQEAESGRFKGEKKEEMGAGTDPPPITEGYFLVTGEEEEGVHRGEDKQGQIRLGQGDRSGD